MNNCQQEGIEEITTRLNDLGHPIKDVFSSAKDFSNPTKSTVELYFNVYKDVYGKDTLRAIEEEISKILEIRNQVTFAMQKLGFHFHEGSFFRGLNNFGIFIQNLLTGINFDLPDEYVKNEIIYDVKLSELEKKIESGINAFIKEVQELISQNLSQEELENKVRDLIIRLNTFFSKYKIFFKGNLIVFSMDSSENHCKINRHNNSDKVEYHSKERSSPVYIKDRLIFISNFIEYTKKKREFDGNLEYFKPSNKLLEKLQKEKFIYGAKGAYQRFLKSFLHQQKVLVEARATKFAVNSILKINNLLQGEINDPRETLKLVEKLTDSREDDNDFFEFKLLPSLEVGIDLYKAWKSGNNIENDLKELYKKSIELISENKEYLPAKCSSLIIRSSAVYSEDNDMTSGAGIYQSINNIKTFSEFRKAVIKVFKSVDSKIAKNHQQIFGIEEESMGLVIQPYVEFEKNDRGHLNSSRPYSKHLLDFINDAGFQLTLDKRYLPIDLTVDGLFHFFISHHFNADFLNDNAPAINTKDLTKMLYAFESYLGKDLQIEFVGDYIVQMRPIVHNKILEEKVSFPNIDSIYEGRSIVMGDIIAKPKEILFLDSSYEATVENDLYEIESGNIKLVIIEDSFKTINGHIETLCAEKGVLCIVNNPLSSHECSIPRNVPLRGVGDGDIGRVYLV